MRSSRPGGARNNACTAVDLQSRPLGMSYVASSAGFQLLAGTPPSTRRNPTPAACGLAAAMRCHCSMRAAIRAEQLGRRQQLAEAACLPRRRVDVRCCHCSLPVVGTSPANRLCRWCNCMRCTPQSPKVTVMRGRLCLLVASASDDQNYGSEASIQNKRGVNGSTAKLVQRDAPCIKVARLLLYQGFKAGTATGFAVGQDQSEHCHRAPPHWPSTPCRRPTHRWRPRPTSSSSSSRYVRRTSHSSRQ